VHYDEGLIMRLPLLPDDDLRLPDLQAWIGFFGGYDKISPEAWEQWDRLNQRAANCKSSKVVRRAYLEDEMTNPLRGLVPSHFLAH
jgi:hypothetical protein